MRPWYCFVNVTQYRFSSAYSASCCFVWRTSYTWWRLYEVIRACLCTFSFLFQSFLVWLKNKHWECTRVNGDLIFKVAVFPGVFLCCCIVKGASFHNDIRKNSKERIRFCISSRVCMRAALQWLHLASMCPTWKILMLSACACLNEPSLCLHLFRQIGSNQQAGTDKILSKNDISRNSCRLWHSEEMEGEKEGNRERRTIDQKRHGKERWPDCSAGQEHGKEAAGKAGPQSGLALCCFWWVPLWPSSPPFPPPRPCPQPPSRTAACHGSLRRNKMISSHLLMNTGHHGSHAKAEPFVLDRDHWYVGGGAVAEGWRSQYCF